MDMKKPTLGDLEKYKHVIMTSDEKWDPSIFDNNPDPLDESPDEGTDEYDPELEIFTCLLDIADELKEPETPLLSVMRNFVNNKNPDYEKLRPYFGWVPAKRIRETLKNTTQWYKAEARFPLRKHYKTRFPAANVDRLNEKVATDTLISNTPALDDGIMGHGGATMAQIYVGCTSQITEGYPMSSESQMHSTLMDFIRDHGAPNILFSDKAKAQIGHNVTEICRHYNIGQQTSEPHYQH